MVTLIVALCTGLGRRGGHFSHNFGSIPQIIPKFSEYLSQVTGKALVKIWNGKTLTSLLFLGSKFFSHTCISIYTCRLCLMYNSAKVGKCQLVNLITYVTFAGRYDLSSSLCVAEHMQPIFFSHLYILTKNEQKEHFFKLHLRASCEYFVLVQSPIKSGEKLMLKFNWLTFFAWIFIKKN